MSHLMMTKLAIASFLLFPLLLSVSTQNATNFMVTNNCLFNVSAAASPGGGLELPPGQAWAFDFNFGSNIGVTVGIWGWRACATGPDTGELVCETGDCDGMLQCQGYGQLPFFSLGTLTPRHTTRGLEYGWALGIDIGTTNRPLGQPPNTLAEFALNQFDNLDFFDISLVDGFNLPMEILPTSNGCTKGPVCSADINSQCPAVLQAPGGCNNPCTVFKTDECASPPYSQFFSKLCPDAYSYPNDETTPIYSCPTFCPS
ncbi:hypothetical protein Dimus_008731 [Dionaea muscipula]